MKKILILTGPAGDAQGWGNLDVTRQLCDTLNTNDRSAEIVFLERKQDFMQAIENTSYDIVWSALYHISTKPDIVGVNDDEGLWIADILDTRGIPYIGHTALTMKQLIQKNVTHEILAQSQVRIPDNFTVDISGSIPAPEFPVFVKPSCESRSVGISDDSVANTLEELEKAVRYIHTAFEQPALIEEYLQLAKVQRFGSSSEKLPFQADIFDEAELEVALSDLEAQLPEDEEVVRKTRSKKRKRGGQVGHKRHERAAFPLEEVDRAWEYFLESCPDSRHVGGQATTMADFRCHRN